MNEKNNNTVINPCINVCKTDPISGFCYGCGRSAEDKSLWKNDDTTNDMRQENLILIKERLTGWQQEAFNESYSYKIKNGMSLIMKKINESKK